jgi:predicted glycogen debranching enzyme
MTLADPRLPSLNLSHHDCNDLQTAVAREWLVTNGIGGYAMGTVAGALTRRYHGLLIAALNPPIGRQLLCTKLDETLTVAGAAHPLFTNFFAGGATDHPGIVHLESFTIEAGIPTWVYTVGAARLTKRIWMEDGLNVTYVQYSLCPDSRPAQLDLNLLVNDRDHHHITHASGQVDARLVDADLVTRVWPSGNELHVCCRGLAWERIRWTIDPQWWHGFFLAIENDRGLDDHDDNCRVAQCTLHIEPGEQVIFGICGGDHQCRHEHALERCRAISAGRLIEHHAHAPGDHETPEAVRQLALAADQFLVRRKAENDPEGHTIIAGYPWFSDWGRDTMIALPGLTLITGRYDVARHILLTWARHVEQGMIPNRFPDEGHPPEYNTADATLWYLWAIDQYIRTTDDLATLELLLPRIEEIIESHVQGTRHGIGLDKDGLIRAGEPGQNLTWMDAKVNGEVITPRYGRPIELTALWHHGLCAMIRWCGALGKHADKYVELRDRAALAFAMFWNPTRNACADVIADDGTIDARIRPNQILAVSLDSCPLSASQQAGVVKAVQEELLTPVGLRTRSPNEPDYHGVFTGPMPERDRRYHTGTAWGWLLGPFVIAHFRVHQDREAARKLLEPMFAHLTDHCVGSISEIFDGDPPHTPHGCIAQAWSVAETLRAWHITQFEAE